MTRLPRNWLLVKLRVEKIIFLTPPHDEYDENYYSTMMM